MRRFFALVTLSAFLQPAFVLAAVVNPADLSQQLFADARPKSFAIESHAHITEGKETWVAVWFKGRAEGEEKLDGTATVDIAQGSMKMRIRSQIRVLDGTFYVRLSGIDGNYDDALMNAVVFLSMKQWISLPMPEDLASMIDSISETLTELDAKTTATLQPLAARFVVQKPEQSKTLDEWIATMQQWGVGNVRDRWSIPRIPSSSVSSRAVRSSASSSASSSYKGRVSRRTLRQIEQQKLDRKLPRANSSSSEAGIVATGLTLFGDKESPVTIVEFTDYQCPFCNRFHHDTFSKIQAAYWTADESRVRFVIRNFPLSFHPNAYPLAQAVECARNDAEADGRWLSLKIFKEQHQSSQAITLAHVYQWLEDSANGIDHDVVKKCVTDGDMNARIDADIAAGSAAGVSGTPSFIVIAPDGSTQIISGAQPFEAFRSAIDAALLK